jgi:hypothetical protein
MTNFLDTLETFVISLILFVFSAFCLGLFVGVVFRTAKWVGGF